MAAIPGPFNIGFDFSAGGSRILSPTQGGGVYEKPSEAFAAVGDGVTDDLAAFNSWFSTQSELILRPGRSYFISQRLDLIQKQIRLCVNGAKIIAPNGLVTVRQRSSYSAGGYFTTVKNAATFAIPSGVPIVAGDLLTLWSNDIFQTTGAYHHGQWTRVVSVAGGVATIDPPFYEAYSVDTIRVIKPISPIIDGVSNGILDLTGVIEQATGSALVGINLVGDSPTLKNLRILGNDYVGRGAFLEGMTPYAENCYAHGITNKRGQKDGSGNLTSSIEGYGLEFDGDDCLAYRVTGENCKHPVTAAQRTHTTRKLTFRECTFLSPLGGQSQISDVTSAAPKYQGADAHGNVKLLRVEKCVSRMVNTHYDCRAVRTEIVESTLISRGADDNFNNDIMINARENPADVHVENLTFGWETPVGPSDPVWAFGIQPWWAANHVGIFADKIALDENIGLFNIPPNNVAATAAAVSVGSLSFTNIGGKMREGVKVVGSSGEAPLGPIGAITTNAKAAENVVIGGLLVNVDYVASLASVSTSGLFNGLTDHTSLIDLPPTYGPELLINGDMSAATGWTIGNAGGSASSSISGGVLNLAGDGTNAGYASQALSLAAGTYKFAWDIVSGAGFAMRIGTSFLGSQVFTKDTSASAYALFTLASAQTVYISARKQTAGAGVVDNLSIKKQLTS